MLPDALQIAAAVHLQLGRNGDLHVERRLVARRVVVREPCHGANRLAEHRGTVAGRDPAVLGTIWVDVRNRLAWYRTVTEKRPSKTSEDLMISLLSLRLWI
jgi:hypothetical protein